MVRAKTGHTGAIAAVVVLLGALFVGHLARSATAAPLRAETEVEVDDNYFEPKNLTVAVGTTVEWKNEGQRTHTVTADDHSFDSGDLAHDGDFTFTFTTAGTYAYYCEHHGEEGGQGMAGTITVTASGGATAPATMPETGIPAGRAAALLMLAIVVGTVGIGLRRRAHRAHMLEGGAPDMATACSSLDDQT
jgi:plastocyanin